MRRNVQGTEEQKATSAARADPDVAALARLRPDQVDAWVDANVNTIADVRALLKRVLKVVVVLARRL